MLSPLPQHNRGIWLLPLPQRGSALIHSAFINECIINLHAVFTQVRHVITGHYNWRKIILFYYRKPCNGHVFRSRFRVLVRRRRSLSGRQTALRGCGRRPQSDRCGDRDVTTATRVRGRPHQRDQQRPLQREGRTASTATCRQAARGGRHVWVSSRRGDARPQGAWRYHGSSSLRRDGLLAAVQRWAGGQLAALLRHSARGRSPTQRLAQRSGQTAPD